MKNKNIRVFESFAGYGGGSFALQLAKIPYEVVGFSEINKHAIQIYKQNHGDIKNFGDIKKINPKDLPDFDLFLGGFPCQAFSMAGKKKGELDPRGTLFYEIIRICEAKQPQYILLENVKGLTFNKFRGTLEKILSELKRIGYNVNCLILNSKDYGTPQSRERIWFLCEKGEQKFSWCQDLEPPKEKLKLVVQDLLEEKVDKKYWLTPKQKKTLLKSMSPIEGTNRKRTWSKIDPKIAMCQISRQFANSRGNFITYQYTRNTLREYKKGISPTLTASMGTGGHNVPFVKNPIRKLTPKECFRLMGFHSEMLDKINIKNISDNQLYKLAGNGWEIQVASKVLRKLLVDKK